MSNAEQQASAPMSAQVQAVLQGARLNASNNMETTLASELTIEEQDQLLADAAKAAANLQDTELEALEQAAQLPAHLQVGELTIGSYIDEMLMHCAQLGASDINILNDQPIRCEVNGLYLRIMRRPLINREILQIATRLYGGPGADGLIASGKDIDPPYDIRSGTKRVRFRVNMVGVTVNGTLGIQITLRIIKSSPMRLPQMLVEEGITKNFKHPNGLVVICGPTGSGKTSLLAGMMCDILEDKHSHRKIVTYEAPIEIVYDEVDTKSSMIAQTEIPTHLGSFALGVRNALRRAPKIILVGESRDSATINASLEASETGHTVYTTVHANNSVAETLYRMVNMFELHERATKLYEIVEAIRLVVIQRLERTPQGGRVAVREYLSFTREIRAELVDATDLRDVARKLARLVPEHGQTMLQSAQNLHSQGRISDEVLARYTKQAELEKAQRERSERDQSLA